MKKKIKKICVFSGKRGGFGAYMPLMKLIEKDPSLELQILLGDMHASKEFGETFREVKTFFPKSRIEVIRMGAGRGDTPLIRAENLGTALFQAAGLLSRMKPDILMIHADRGEHLVVAHAALNLGIPVAHTQGGEVSGNIDDIQRHAIAKLAHIHFPETKKAAERIRNTGEEPWRIYVVGSLYIDRIIKKMYTSSKTARKKYGLGEKEDFGIVIFHPDTYLTENDNTRAAEAVFQAASSSGLSWVAVYPCSDPGYKGIISVLNRFKNNSRFHIFKNINNLDFLGLMSRARIILGNSSSAFVEAPYFKLPAVNVGARQVGRDREENIVDAKTDKASILRAVHGVLGSVAFQNKRKVCGRALGDGRAAEKIIKVLKEIPLNERLFRKKLVVR